MAKQTSTKDKHQDSAIEGVAKLMQKLNQARERRSRQGLPGAAGAEGWRWCSHSWRVVIDCQQLAVPQIIHKQTTDAGEAVRLTLLCLCACLLAKRVQAPS